MSHHLSGQNSGILIFQTNHSIKTLSIENHMRNHTGNCIYIYIYIRGHILIARLASLSAPKARDSIVTLRARFSVYVCVTNNLDD